jgi:hypothetical protein
MRRGGCCCYPDKRRQFVSKIRERPTDARQEHLPESDRCKIGEDADAKGNNNASGKDATDRRDHVA